MLFGWVRSDTAYALGWTMVHSLWEGALIAVALAMLLAALRSPRLRYAAACVAMLSLLALAGGTFGVLLPGPAAHSVASVTVHSPGLNFNERWGAADGSARQGFVEFLPWLAPFWAAGVLIFQLRTLASCLFAQRIRRRGVCCPTDVWQQRLDALRGRMAISRPVRLLESCLADVPVVTGHLRPLILMPVGMLANLSVQQVESILLHELAHIRRYDYLVNLLQTSMEGLLFYHPAMWWISNVIRAEREKCCDDVVVAIHGNAHEYATALAALEDNRWTLNSAGMAATGGDLMNRIRRLLGQPGNNNHLAPVFSAALLTVIGAVVLAAWQAPPASSANPAFGKWLNEDVVYIIKGEEKSAFEHLRTDSEREQFIKQFWIRRDPTPSTPENEAKESHYRRIAYVNERFDAGTIPGWKSDRGRVYITYGPPDEIESHPSGAKYDRPSEQGGGVTATFPFEKWLYRRIPGVGNNVLIDFVDRSGLGEYKQTSDPNGSLFQSTTPGAQAYVMITPERRASMGIPLDFEAKQYSVSLSVRTSGGQNRWKSSTVVSLCKDSPQTSGCLQRPIFALETNPLEAGTYMLEAIVTDGSGLKTRSYSVDFSIK